eukprot:Nitzschia sp. Nitz4//scaffold133_size116822//59458//63473//NITZ4_003808-RA/size116822-processed-gene-0.32-mRNA-1//1//CDS//3329535399//211//frame0
MEMVSATHKSPPGHFRLNSDQISNLVGANNDSEAPLKSSKASTVRKPSFVKNRMTSKLTPHIPAAVAPPEGEESDRVRLGICAMDKKARSTPMAEILSRLDEKDFHVIFFGDDLILNQPVEAWPKCQVLIAFFSKGYPLEKVKEYVELTRPFILNDLNMQTVLKDRRKVYDLLQDSGIDVPRHVFLSKDDYVSTGMGDGDGRRSRLVQEFDDHIIVNGVTIHKPFVEKPVDADDHNIAIYYPTSAGGGCKKLFRKIGNRSSEFYPDINEVRRDGSYIYEEFVETQGTDVKMYTVGPEYGHAEARKSPTVDGKVQRNSDGKEVRFPVILTLGEKEIARRIVLGFKQFVCGFDLLRVQEGHSVVSYVCDVNGFSFVKNSRKYYDDCAQILSEHVLATVKPKSLRGFSTLDPLIKKRNNGNGDDKFPILNRVARLLHGEPPADLSQSGDSNHVPSIVEDSPALSEQSGRSQNAATKLVEGAIPVRDLPRNLVSEPATLVPSNSSSVEDLVKLERESNKKDFSRSSSSMSVGVTTQQEELRCVIAVVRHGDRTPKQKLKVNMSEPLILNYFMKHCEDPTKDLKVKAKAPLTEFLVTVKTILAKSETERREAAAKNKTVKQNNKLLIQLRHMRDILERWRISGLNRKLQIKPRAWDEASVSGVKQCKEVQLILKWGGNLTKLGENQAIALGERLRQDLYPDAPGGGILRLHSTFRHDMKIKTSDEGRVMKTAAAFAKGLLELEGEIPPILVSLVHKEKGSMHMLDPSGDKEVKLELDECKERITANLQRDIDFKDTMEKDREQMVGPRELRGMREALAEVGNPRKTLMEIHKTMGNLIDQLEEMLGHMGSGDEKRIEGGEGLEGDEEEETALSGVKLYKGETLLELVERWKFIHKRLYDADDDTFDLSRIPDVHDNVRFDVLHNPHLGLTSTLEKLYTLAKRMADCVVPQEYGTTIAEKRSVGVKICSSLLEKIRYDLNIARTDNKTDMRYMINMDYSADLPINTMGRRIRTRLYFTSESHLHTMLNCMRFAGCESILSHRGKKYTNNARELCYLTQIVIRLFEDTQRPMDDPRRFRVEILFSPGATATPLHIHQDNRDADLTRLDTAPLEMIGRDGLTCEDVEAFLSEAIREGGHESSDDHLEVMSTATADFLKRQDDPSMSRSSSPYVTNPKTLAAAASTDVATEDSSAARELFTEDQAKSSSEALEEPPTSEPVVEPNQETNVNTSVEPKEVSSVASAEEPNEQPKEETVKDIAREGSDSGFGGGGKYLWSTVAMGALLLGAGCLALAMKLSAGPASYRQRHSIVRR